MRRMHCDFKPGALLRGGDNVPQALRGRSDASRRPVGVEPGSASSFRAPSPEDHWASVGVRVEVEPGSASCQLVQHDPLEPADDLGL